MRPPLSRLSGLLAAVLLLQWAAGIAACIAFMAPPGSPDLAICHAASEAAPHAPDVPANHDLAASVCPLCVHLSTTVPPEPPNLLPGPPLVHIAVLLPDALCCPVPARLSRAHPARGPPTFS